MRSLQLTYVELIFYGAESKSEYKILINTKSEIGNKQRGQNKKDLTNQLPLTNHIGY